MTETLETCKANVGTDEGETRARDCLRGCKENRLQENAAKNAAKRMLQRETSVSRGRGTLRAELYLDFSFELSFFLQRGCKERGKKSEGEAARAVTAYSWSTYLTFKGPGRATLHAISVGETLASLMLVEVPCAGRCRGLFFQSC